MRSFIQLIYADLPLRELKPAYLKTSAPCLRNGKKLLPFYRASEGCRMAIGIHFSDKAVTVFLLMGGLRRTVSVWGSTEGLHTSKFCRY